MFRLNHLRGTIFALSTAPSKSAIAVVRTSGPLSSKLFPIEKPRIAKFAKLLDNNGELIDTAILTFYKGPESYTGEDVLEISTHGSIAVINKLCNYLENKGCRKAERGEFTYRAYLNKKMKESEIESLGSLLHAETDVQRKAALLPRKNDRHVINKWRTTLINVLAIYEAQIDFAEDDHVDEGHLHLSLHTINSLSAEIDKYLVDASRLLKIKQGIKIAICGSPNVGKSSFINKICKDEVSIVSEIAGTTRDVIQRYLNIGNYPLKLSDTAGIQSSDDLLESIGINRALIAAKEADILFFIFDPTQPRETQLQLLDRLKKEFLNHIVVIVNKIDSVEAPTEVDPNEIRISCKNGQGFEKLYSNIEALLSSNYSIPDSIVFQSSYIAPLQSIKTYLNQMMLETDIVLKAELLRQSIQQIQRLSNDVDFEDVLESLFSQFCIGK